MSGGDLELIRAAVAQHAKLPRGVDGLTVESDLYAAGMSSHASVNVMLALEDAFELEFPDALLAKATFASLGSIQNAIESLQRTPA
jgi:acyl carrier protein